MKWTTTKLVTAGSIGAVFLILAMSGSIVQSVAGFPGASGIVNGFISGIMFPLVVLLVRNFGAGTIAGLTYYILGLPLAIGGAPGFLPKILVGLVVGLLADILFLLLKKNERSTAVAIGALTQPAIAFLVGGLGLVFSLPGIDKYLNLLQKPISIVAAFVIGAIGGIIAYLIYSKLKNTAVVKRIQGEQLVQ